MKQTAPEDLVSLCLLTLIDDWRLPNDWLAQGSLFPEFSYCDLGMAPASVPDAEESMMGLVRRWLGRLRPAYGIGFYRPYLQMPDGAIRPSPILKRPKPRLSKRRVGPGLNERKKLWERLPTLDLSMFPSGLSRVPFAWKFPHGEYSMEFLGGFIGLVQNQDHSVQPAIGWAVREQIEDTPVS